jgi:membrane protease YdiL (CAAX protease family)
MGALVLGELILLGGIAVPRAPSFDLALQTLSGLIAFGFLTWAIGHKALGLTLQDLRWLPVRGAGKGFGLGVLLGAIPAALAIQLAITSGHASLLRDQGDVTAYLGQLGKTALLLAPAALLEEVMFRGVGQVVLARAFGRLPAILILSMTFACAHLLNPNPTLLAMVNIALAGVFLGLAFYAPGGIWTAWGVHLGWNGALAALDAPVSGLPFRIPLIDYVPGEPGWLTGGSFGPEGGLLATLMIALAASLAWRWGREARA